MFTDKYAEDLMFDSREALDRLTEANKKQKNTLKDLRENKSKFDYGKHFFEVYDIVAYEGKVKVDMLYYQQFLQKLDENTTPQVEKVLISLYKTINNIYEFINICPEIYGNGIDVTLLDSSIEDSKRKLSKVVYEYLDRNFYRLNMDQRKDRYFESHKDYAKELISEGVTPDEAIAFSVKSLVMENLLTHISFPFAVWSRINYLLDSDDYGAIFDKDKLLELVESFQKKIKNVARITATCI